jgi:hypothetical protein
MPSLLRARMPQPLLSVQADDWGGAEPQLRRMLRAFPFRAFAETPMAIPVASLFMETPEGSHWHFA